MKKMRIAVWHNLPSGGGKRALWNHVAGLVKRGHHVEAWCPDSADTNFLPLSPLCPEHILPLAKSRRKKIPKPFGWMADCLEMRARIDAMREHCRDCAAQIELDDFDVLLANSCVQFAAPAIGRYVTIPKAVYLGEPNRPLYEAMPELIWAAPGPDAGQTTTSLYRLLVNTIKLQEKRLQMREEIENARHFDRILVNSFFSRESVLRAYGLEAEVCQLGIDAAVFRPTREPVENFLMGLGTVHFHKGVDRAIRALALVPAEIRPRLVWVGNHSCEQEITELSALAKNCGVEFELKVMVPDAELVSLLSRAAALLYTSRLEPFGLAPLEANACGTPVIAIAEGGVRESIVNGENGWLVPDARPETIARAVRKFFAEPMRAAELRARCRDVVLTRWSMDDAVDRLETALAEVIANKKKL
jgi:glycosyltransferase involved in cell wall biosynthesis